MRSQFLIFISNWLSDTTSQIDLENGERERDGEGIW